MKFYFVSLTHKDVDKTFYKFGITSQDVEARFDPKYDKRYSEFDIKTLGLLEGNDEEIKAIEQAYLTKYPKNLYLEEYLEKPYAYYNGMSGITEIVNLENEVVEAISTELSKTELEGIYMATLNSAFITNAGYLSILQTELDETQHDVISIGRDQYSTLALRRNISYNDSTDNHNRPVYRWSKNAHQKCKI